MKVEGTGESVTIQQVIVNNRVVAEIAPGFGVRWIGFHDKPTIADLRDVVDALAGSRSNAPLELSGMLKLTDVELFHAIDFEKVASELESIQQSGYCNMLDATCLSDVLQQLGFTDAFVLTSQVVHRRQAAKSLFLAILTGGPEAADKIFRSLLPKAANAAAKQPKPTLL